MTPIKRRNFNQQKNCLGYCIFACKNFMSSLLWHHLLKYCNDDRKFFINGLYRFLRLIIVIVTRYDNFVTFIFAALLSLFFQVF